MITTDLDKLWVLCRLYLVNYEWSNHEESQWNSVAKNYILDIYMRVFIKIPTNAWGLKYKVNEFTSFLKFEIITSACGWFDNNVIQNMRRRVSIKLKIRKIIANNKAYFLIRLIPSTMIVLSGEVTRSWIKS